MALPSSGYSVATLTNPDSDLVDFTLLIDRSRHAQSYWDAVDTSDATKGRFAKDSGPTELAGDPTAFDDTAETGWARVLWSGTLSATGTQKVRDYPPQSGNTSYSASATFGQHNAYDANWEGYWPDGGGTDRTSNNRDMSTVGTPTLSGSGKVGDAYDHDDQTDGHELTNGIAALSESSALSMMAWFNGNTSPASGPARVICGQSLDSVNLDDRVTMDVNGGEAIVTVYDGSFHSKSATASSSAWHHLAMTSDGAATPDVSGWLDGSSMGGSSTAGINSNDSDWYIGISAETDQGFDGLIDDVQAHSTERPSAWISEEYAQTNDQDSFWSLGGGTWTWVAPSGGAAAFPFTDIYSIAAMAGQM